MIMTKGERAKLRKLKRLDEKEQTEKTPSCGGQSVPHYIFHKSGWKLSPADAYRKEKETIENALKRLNEKAQCMKQLSEEREAINMARVELEEIKNMERRKESATVIAQGREHATTGTIRNSRIGKGRFDLISPIALRNLAEKLEAGLSNYSDRNWEKGQPLSWVYDSAMRHLNRFMEDLMKGHKSEEDHMGAAFYNIHAFIHTADMIREGHLPKTLDDLSYLNMDETKAKDYSCPKYPDETNARINVHEAVSGLEEINYSLNYIPLPPTPPPTALRSVPPKSEGWTLRRLCLRDPDLEKQFEFGYREREKRAFGSKMDDRVNKDTVPVASEDVEGDYYKGDNCAT